jgi:hypothetical protein
MAETKHRIGPAPYASSGDFRRIFYEENESLHRLSFLLTADREKAEQCFVRGLQESVNGSPVFKQWAHSWARRTIMQDAVRIINPPPIGRTCPFEFRQWWHNAGSGAGRAAEGLPHEPFERLVYVMSVLERCSDLDCSVLSGCARREVIAARMRAFQQFEMQSDFHLKRRVNGETLNRASTGDLR